jgi:hypothetical protein
MTNIFCCYRNIDRSDLSLGSNWFVLQGQEQNGWTAIQFKRYFDTCDPMDVPIKV